ncbi:hypothetical protein BD780_001293 [Clostridium tetanomorphum]|uniref:DUF4440 domain-containing protein n=1 Tax=Clostridium tetanomorphum TaxID=1553 RepID=A0A923E7F0_CLOTT|nr:DUF4440 domain-containing protein [Clostridium tetanomorphum]KAJ53592.1 hypothetical protein CTM_01884 [Clostridium tetanomorphum DSM 665]MBC2397798.1 DUF4440 domain-containing protein [Clostridium tetanomorphum]MBP1864599.1 hypothetical protein [Clostridium tetanomorphum]NRS84068.1 hypothetical protein [Clostridium tetanomorphum]NRZ97282.1 hypothetical protein [Clostridium tetanomorphum]
MKTELLEKHIYDLEKEALKTETRQSAKRISELLSDDFTEFSSSGQVYYYNKGDVFDENNDSVEINWEIKEFAIKLLSHDVILSMYKVIKHSELNESKKYSLRSSIWKCFNGT